MLQIFCVSHFSLPYVPFNFCSHCSNAALSGSGLELFYLCRTPQRHLGFCEIFFEHKDLIFLCKTHKFPTESETKGVIIFNLKLLDVISCRFIHRHARLKFANEAGACHSEIAEPISNLLASVWTSRPMRMHRDAGVSNDNCDVIGQPLTNKRPEFT